MNQTLAPGRLFYSHPLVHTAWFNCHPGVIRTILFLKRYLWCESLERDVNDYVAACSSCVCSKSNTQCPLGLLQCLPTPHRAWSYIALHLFMGG